MRIRLLKNYGDWLADSIQEVSLGEGRSLVRQDIAEPAGAYIPSIEPVPAPASAQKPRRASRATKRAPAKKAASKKRAPAKKTAK